MQFDSCFLINHINNQYIQQKTISQQSIQTIYHISQESLSHTQPPALKYTQQKNISKQSIKTIYHISQESISHTQPPALKYTQQNNIPNWQ